jgi:hypothetical protein
VNITDPTPWLAVANQHDVRKLSLDGQRDELLLRDFQFINTLDIHYERGELYFVNTIELYRVKFDSIDVDSPPQYEEIGRQVVEQFKAIAIDWVTKYVQTHDLLIQSYF